MIFVSLASISPGSISAKNLLNSLLIAVSVAVIGTFITYFTAYATARIKER